MMRLGYIRDRPDARDEPLARLSLRTSVPSSFTLRPFVTSVLDQGDTSSCVAHSWAQALRIADRIAGESAPVLCSREFLYWNSRAYDGGAIVDQGTQLRSCARGLVKFGRPPETVWPFDLARINERPDWSAYRLAYKFKGPAGYYRITTLAEIRQALAASKPVVGGVGVGDSIFQARGSAIYDPAPGEPSIGGHAMTIVGYDADSFTICNSWGTGWGDRGFVRMAPRFVQRFTDLWAVHV